MRSFFFCGSPVELRKKFENTSVSVYRRGVSITTKGQFIIYFGQNNFFYWLCRRFLWHFLTFLTDYSFTDFLLTFLTCDIPAGVWILLCTKVGNAIASKLRVLHLTTFPMDWTWTRRGGGPDTPAKMVRWFRLAVAFLVVCERKTRRLWSAFSVDHFAPRAATTNSRVTPAFRHCRRLSAPKRWRLSGSCQAAGALRGRQKAFVGRGESKQPGPPADRCVESIGFPAIATFHWGFCPLLEDYRTDCRRDVTEEGPRREGPAGAAQPGAAGRRWSRRLSPRKISHKDYLVLARGWEANLWTTVLAE